ncbi:MAG: geranylgeranylglycerol-phosphate geranylgeranyltransferase [Bacteroidia bacterium]
MISFLRLIRWPNLLIMAFTQYMVRFFLVDAWLSFQNCGLDMSVLRLRVSEFDFFLLVLATTLIAAAGYIINDYFDVRIDKVNRPETNLVGKTIKRRVAILLHTLFNVVGVALGIFLSWKYDQLRLGLFIYITTPALLWFYSTNLKKQPLIGNVVIALLSALVPLMVALLELPTQAKEHVQLIQIGYLDLKTILNFTAGYAFFAFVISLLREIIKDTEDYEGDLEYGCRTLPIVLGIAPTKWIICSIAIFLVILIGWLQTNFLVNPSTMDYIAFFWFLVLVQLPLLFLAWRVYKAETKKHYQIASLITKLIMVAGISFLFLFPTILAELCTQNG